MRGQNIHEVGFFSLSLARSPSSGDCTSQHLIPETGEVKVEAAWPWCRSEERVQ